MITSLLLAWAMALPATAATPGAGSAWQLAGPERTSFAYPEDLERLTVVLFWATWCPYCKQLLPHLQSIVDEHGPSDIDVIAVSVFERDDGDPTGYLGERGYQFELLLAGDDVAKQWSVHGTPGLFLVDADGNVVWHLGQAQQAAARTDGVQPHWQRATRRAPFWAAELRKAIASQLAQP